ncbi:transcription factor IIIA isoform X2 [Procambarus clarkii]|uniref:transcription factor IIIA isoform X2 n=1 Tax=Procambarus clarkii TaxID=6728 RepID=UPI001E671D5F|nr:zinc finger protein 567-like isoform X2 [Procambarus clarkii]
MAEDSNINLAKDVKSREDESLHKEEIEGSDNAIDDEENEKYDIFSCKGMTGNCVTADCVGNVEQEKCVNIVNQNKLDCINNSDKVINLNNSEQSDEILSGNKGVVTVHGCAQEGYAKSFCSPERLAEHQTTHSSEIAKENNVSITIEVEPVAVYESDEEGDESYSKEETDTSDSTKEGSEIDEINTCDGMTDDYVTTKAVKSINQEIEVNSCKKNIIDYIESNDTVLNITTNKRRLGISSGNRGSLIVHACTYEGCTKAFCRPNLLAQHQRTHTGERPYVCPVAWCSRSYTRQQHLKRHMETGHQEKKSEEKLKCDKCEKFFSNVYSLKKHHFRYHVRNLFKCDSCDQTFKNQQHLYTHSYVHTGIKPFKCDFPGCDVRCEAPSRLKRHKRVHEKNRYSCPRESCGKTFDEYKDLQHHLSVGHPRVCDICSKSFQTLQQLKTHRLTHKNDKVPYYCPVATCDKYFYQKQNLKAHIAVKHDQSKIFECGVCSRRLSSKQKLMHHTKTHTPGYKRNYSCTPGKPRKPRKDKGVLRKDVNRYLSVYYSDDESRETKDLEGNTNDKTIEEPQCQTNLNVNEEISHVSVEEMNVKNMCQASIEATVTS